MSNTFMTINTALITFSCWLHGFLCSFRHFFKVHAIVAMAIFTFFRAICGKSSPFAFCHFCTMFFKRSFFIIFTAQFCQYFAACLHLTCIFCCFVMWQMAIRTGCAYATAIAPMYSLFEFLKRSFH